MTPTPIALPSANAPKIPVVYILRNKGIVVYVGQTRNLRRRLMRHSSPKPSHGALTRCDWDDASFIEAPCDLAERLKLERRYIRKFAPKFNSPKLADIRGKRLAVRQAEWHSLRSSLPVRLVIYVTRREMRLTRIKCVEAGFDRPSQWLAWLYRRAIQEAGQ